MNTTEEQARQADQARQAMRQRGWSYARLSSESGVAENTVSDFLAGRKSTQPAKVRQMLDALGIPMHERGALIVEDVPEDVRIFATVAAQRLSALENGARNRALARLYPVLLMETGDASGFGLTEEVEGQDLGE